MDYRQFNEIDVMKTNAKETGFDADPLIRPAVLLACKKLRAAGLSFCYAPMCPVALQST